MSNYDNFTSEQLRKRRGVLMEAVDEASTHITEIDNRLGDTTPSYPASMPKNMTFGHGASRTTGGTVKRQYESLGEQLQKIMQAGMPGGKTDHRLHLVNAATGLGETIPSDGGFIIQSDFSDELLKGVFDTGKLAKLCNRVQVGGNANSINLPAPDETSRATGSRWGGIRGYWAAEAAEKTASKPTFRKVNLELKKLVGLCYATDELLEDARMLETVILQGFSDEFGFMLDDAIINGLGAGQPLGVLNAGCTVSQAKESAQTATTIVTENVLKMWSRLLPGSQERAVWVCNNDTLPQLYSMGLTAGSGGALVFMPPNGISGNPYSTLMGRPVIPIEHCQTLGTVGDIILADLAGGYILAEKGGMQADMSIHVRFIYDESVFRFVLRVDGSPVLSSAVTPYKGSNTQSHFVTLATRS